MKLCIHFGRRALALPVLMLAGGIAHGAGHQGPVEATVYRITHLEPPAGAVSGGTAINERGWVAGFYDPGDQTRRAVLWRDDEAIELGTLGGPNSNVPWPGINNRGMVVGISATDVEDPDSTTWSCRGFFPTITGHNCLGFVWENGEMRELPTLGGNNGFATGVNSRGQIVGWAETDIEDPSCTGTQKFGFLAALWELDGDQISVTGLPPFGDGSATAATAINESGQVVGISGICGDAVGRFSARHAVMWENGIPIDLGNIGGETWNTPMAINAGGEVVGFANIADDEDGGFNAHAFYWNRHDGIRSLGTLEGNLFSQAHGINARGQVVGTSFGGAGGQRAFIWEGEDMLDLNNFVEPGYSGLLLHARHISQSGEITGSALAASGAVVPFVATPIRGQGKK
jgi:probable HAF family extracellular repeat protein